MFFKQKTANEWRISDWSSDVRSSDLAASALAQHRQMTPQGTLRISLPPEFYELSFVKVLVEFSQQYPDVRLELDLSPWRVHLVGRTSVVWGKGVSVRVDSGRVRLINKKNSKHNNISDNTNLNT